MAQNPIYRDPAHACVNGWDIYGYIGNAACAPKDNGSQSTPSFPTSPPVVVNRYGAVAWNNSNNQFDSSFNESTTQKAKQLALARCGKSCSIISSYANQCIAISVGFKPRNQGGYRRVEYNINPLEAEAVALNRCNQQAQNCEIVLSECSRY
ncbi:MAG: DUF4189 domain-containing protein [Formosimonas sp.]